MNILSMQHTPLKVHSCWAAAMSVMSLYFDY